MKKWIILSVIVALFLSGCAAPKQHQKTYLTVFDTVTTVTAYGGSDAKFEENAGQIYDILWDCHRLFDIYHEYSGINNLKTVNDQAGIAPVAVDDRIIALLQDCAQYYTLTGGRVNVAMGSVLSLWHEAREEGLASPESAALPDEDALLEAAAHCSWEHVIIDADAGTVFLADPEMSLDVGAVAKGWAAQKAAEAAPAGYLLNVGGNVIVTGVKDSRDTPWVIGIASPDGSSYLHTVSLTAGAMVTSGNYQRLYYVDGTAYHHIIDPDTLMPGTLWRAVSIYCPDSALADILSTALFLLPRQEGERLLESCGAEAMWLDGDGNVFCSPGFSALLNEK